MPDTGAKHATQSTWQMLMAQSGEHAPPMMLEPHTVWFHGSPFRLAILRAGSTVTPVMDLARAFAHKPANVSMTIRERDGERTVIIDHDGKLDGYLYKVLVEDPREDMQQHPGSGLALGEEMLTTRDLPVEFIEELPLGGG